MTDLLPCPFCGGQARLHYAVGDDWVACENCQAQTALQPSRLEALGLWYRRAPSPEIAALKAQLAEAQAGLSETKGMLDGARVKMRRMAHRGQEAQEKLVDAVALLIALNDAWRPEDYELDPSGVDAFKKVAAFLASLEGKS